MMSRVQELIDERMKENPTGLTKELLEACKAETAMPELYRLTVTWVTAMAYIDKQHDPAAKLLTSKQTLIVESVSSRVFAAYVRDEKMCSMDLIKRGIILETWKELPMPHAMQLHDGEVMIIHAIEPYPKRTRLP